MVKVAKLVRTCSGAAVHLCLGLVGAISSLLWSLLGLYRLCDSHGGSSSILRCSHGASVSVGGRRRHLYINAGLESHGIVEGPGVALEGGVWHGEPDLSDTVRWSRQGAGARVAGVRGQSTGKLCKAKRRA